MNKTMARIPKQHLKTLFLLAAILILTFVAYYPSISFDFIIWDDDTHLINLVHSESLNPTYLKKLFTSTVNNTYIPLTSFSFAIEYKYFALNPSIYHLDNIFLHLGVITCLFILAIRLGINIRAAAIAALIFAVHPMHIESVVWITERKDVLYSFFYLLSVVYYLDYLKQKKVLFYSVSIFFCLLSILSKPMALSLPLILFLCDWQIKRPFNIKMIIDKIPYAIIIEPITWLTYVHHIRIPGNNLIEGLLVWIWTFVFHIQKFFFPDKLLPIYQLPEPITFFSLPYFVSLLLFIGLIVMIVKLHKNRWFIFSLLFYFFSIFFLLRFDSVADVNVVADRFMYLPSVGFCFLIGIVVDDRLTKYHSKSKTTKLVYNGLIAIFIFLLVQMNYWQMQIWTNNYVFWNNLVSQYPNSTKIRVNRVREHLIQNNYQAAMNDLRFILHKSPNNPLALNNMGILVHNLGEGNKSLYYFEKCLSVNKNFADCHYNLGVLYMDFQQYDKAENYFKTTLQKRRYYPKALFQLGNIYFDRGQFERSIDFYNQALHLNPEHRNAHLNRSLAMEFLHQAELKRND